MLTNEATIVDVATRVHLFATGRKDVTKYQKLFIGQYFALSGLAVLAGAFWNPYFLALLPVHTLLSAGLFLMCTKQTEYSARFPPMFHAEDKILSETQRYLEYREFTEYKMTLAKQAAEKVIVMPIDDTQAIRARILTERKLHGA